MLHIVLCDDEPAVVEDLTRRIEALPDFSARGMRLHTLTDPAGLTGDTPCDLLFLDIDLGKTNGIEVARRLRRTKPDMVLIFVTNYKEFAPEGYEVDAFRYLGKDELDTKLAPYFTAALARCRTLLRTVELVCDGEPVAVPLPKLVYIESRGRDQYLHLQGAARDCLVTHTTMNALEETLADQGFLRLHKSYLVNMAWLDTLQSSGARLMDGCVLPVSTRSYRANKQRYLAWKGRHIC